MHCQGWIGWMDEWCLGHLFALSRLRLIGLRRWSWDETRILDHCKSLHAGLNLRLNGFHKLGVLCCLTMPGLRKDIRRQIRQLHSHKIAYVHYSYILSSHLLSHIRIYFYYLSFILSYTGLFLWGRKEHGHNYPMKELPLMYLLNNASVYCQQTRHSLLVSGLLSVLRCNWCRKAGVLLLGDNSESNTSGLCVALHTLYHLV